MTSVPDINVLVYAVDESSPFHEACSSWLESALGGASPVAFTWHALSGFVRISTDSRIMLNPCTVDEALDVVEDWLQQPHARIIHPGAHHTPTLRSLLRTSKVKGGLVSDAHLAAMAMDEGAEVCSCDTDFARFSGLRWFNPVTGKRLKP